MTSNPDTEGPYVPINCEFHDVIELRVIRGTSTNVVYLGSDGSRLDANDVIVDVGATAGAEYVVLRGGLRIRLDRIIAIDGVAAPS